MDFRNLKSGGGGWGGEICTLVRIYDIQLEGFEDIFMPHISQIMSIMNRN